MSPLLEAAVEVRAFFRRKRWRFCIIGGLAVIRWGQPRVTQDVDVCLLTGFGSEEAWTMVESLVLNLDEVLNKG